MSRFRKISRLILSAARLLPYAYRNNQLPQLWNALRKDLIS